MISLPLPTKHFPHPVPHLVIQNARNVLCSLRLEFRHHWGLPRICNAVLSLSKGARVRIRNLCGMEQLVIIGESRNPPGFPYASDNCTIIVNDNTADIAIVIETTDETVSIIFRENEVHVASKERHGESLRSIFIVEATANYPTSCTAIMLVYRCTKRATATINGSVWLYVSYVFSNTCWDYHIVGVNFT